MPARARPLSPHLQIYRWQIANTLSILHRLTGVMLSVGLLLLVAWLVALAGGRGGYEAVMRVFGSPLGAVALAAFGFCFFYHFLNGIRHLFWDVGYGFERRARRRSGWLVVAGAVVLTAAPWHIRFISRIDGCSTMSLRSPLGRVLGMGSAKDGTGNWWAQRVSAVALVPLALWFLVSLMSLHSLDYASVRAWFAHPFDGFLAALSVAVLAHHSYLGTVVIVEDYVHSPAAKLASLLALRFLHVLAGGAGVFAILHLTLGTMGS